MLFNKKQKILSKSQLKHLSEHKYNCSSNSLLDALLQPWWCWLVSKTPLHIAPNLLTIVGLFINVLTSVIVFWFSPDAIAEAPRWCYLLCAVGLFVYQSLDAIDGKQARRTNTSSPLGELFDHGCDAISTMFVSLAACCAGGLGKHPSAMFMNCILAMILYYIAHWQTYITGTLKFGRFDVTEAQICIMGIHMFTFMFGVDAWHAGNVPLWLPMAGFSLVTGFFVIMNFCRTFSKGGIGKNGSTVAGTSILSPILPLIFVIIPAYIISEKSKSGIYLNNPVLYQLTFGLLAAKVSCRLVVAHMSKSEMSYFDHGMFGPLGLFLNQYFNEFINEHLVLWMAFIWITFDLCWYCAHVCVEMCDHLNIMLFKIPYPPPKGPSSSISSSSSAKNSKKNLNLG